MRIAFFFILVSCIYSGVSCTKHTLQTSVIIYPDNADIEYTGRWNKSIHSAYISHWGGAYFTLHFNGTTIIVKFSNTPKIRVYIDDDKSGSIQIGKNVLSINGLKQGSHTIVVAAYDQYDEMQLSSITLADTAKVFPPIFKKGVLEFIGNSITAGAGVKNCQDAYPWIVSERLGLDHTQIASSGITLTEGYRNQNSLPHGMIVGYFSLKEPPNDVNIPFNFTDYVPEAIVIELGTNDEKVHVPLAEFQRQYILFLQQIRAKYPSCKLILQGNSFCNSFGNAQIINVVNYFNNRSDTKVYYINTTGWVTNKDLVDGCHPSLAGNKKIADSLLPKLKAILNR